MKKIQRKYVIEVQARIESYSATLYTDGSCIGPVGPGGWAYQLDIHEKNKLGVTTLRGRGGVKGTTNNRMELQAIIAGLHATPAGGTVKVVTDSEYAIGVGSGSARVSANKDLAQKLQDLTEQRTVSWEWVKAHSGHPQNEACDKDAYAAARIMQGQPV